MTTENTMSKIANNCSTCDEISSIFNLQGQEECSSDYNDKSSLSSETTTENSVRIESTFTCRKESPTTLPSLLRVNGNKLENKTFSSDKIREIERKNAILVNKILHHSRRPNQYIFAEKTHVPKVPSAQINRQREQEKISRENQIILKKIQSVKPSVRYKW
ncbi:cilia- and flagella-associated protein 97-like [Cylas formicarius]|uniref:cilia- and flagella-associated protein 97-like n=1 Tax=Cylas formicarius TaxID=197179 RepID=UPI0029589E94|nr:cilia- and flagella-associated protein 97-like [Cylas formicarius]